MPKLAVGTASTDFFSLDGLDYGKGQYQVIYNEVEVDSSGDPDLTKVNVGLQSKYTQQYIQVPTLYSNWTNASDTPYASVTALVTDMGTFVGFSTASGSSDAGIVSQTMNWRVNLSVVGNLYRSRHDAWAYTGSALFVNALVTDYASLAAGVLVQGTPFMFAPWLAEIKSIRIRIGTMNAASTALKVTIYCIDPAASLGTDGVNTFLLSETDEALSGTTFQSIVITPTSVDIPLGYAIMVCIGTTGLGASEVNMGFGIELEKKT